MLTLRSTVANEDLEVNTFVRPVVNNAQMPAARAQAPFAEAVRALLDERGLSLRAVSREANVDLGHLSRIAASAKPVSQAVVLRVTEALKLPPDFFIEARLHAVIAAIEADAELRDRLYDEIIGRACRKRP